MAGLWMLGACGGSPAPKRVDSGASPGADTAHVAPDSETGRLPGDSADSADSGTGLDSADTVDSADTALPEGCLEGHTTIDAAATHTADGRERTNDGLSGQLVLGVQPSRTDAWILGRTASTPSDRPTAGAIVRYPGLEAPDAWLFLDPEEGELEVLAAGDLDGSAGDELVVGIEHPGLVGARVVVHPSDWASGSALDAPIRFESTANGATPLPITGDTDGDGQVDLHIGWADQLDRWAGPLPAGDFAAGDGDQDLLGKTRQWGTTGDVDRDGYADLVTATYDGVVVLLGGASGLTGTISDPDHTFAGPFDAGADSGGIAVGTAADGTPLVAFTLAAETTEDAVVVVEAGLSGTRTELGIGEVGRVSVAWAELDGMPGDELVLGRVPSSTTEGGLWVYGALDAAPLRVAAESADGLLGALFAPTSGALVAVDPWGVQERQARLYRWAPCEE